MEYGIYHLPRNFTDAGRLLGLFEIRNMVETSFGRSRPVSVPVFSPVQPTPKIIVTLTLVVPLGGFGLIGVRTTAWAAGYRPGGAGERADAF